MSDLVDGSTPASETVIAGYLMEQIAILHPPKQASCGPDSPFNELGVDSLDAVSLAGIIEERFAITIDPVEFFDYPTPSALARMIAARCALTSADATATDQAIPAG